MDMTLLEMCPMVAALATWESLFLNIEPLFHIDNQAVIYVINASKVYQHYNISIFRSKKCLDYCAISSTLGRNRCLNQQGGTSSGQTEGISIRWMGKRG